MIDALGPHPSVRQKRGAQRAPLSADGAKRSLRSGLSSRRALNLPRMQAAGAHLDLRDLPIDNDTGHLEIRLPDAARSIVRV